MEKPATITRKERLFLRQLDDLLAFGFDGTLLVRPSVVTFRMQFASSSLPFLKAALTIFASHEEYEFCGVLKNLIDERSGSQSRHQLPPDRLSHTIVCYKAVTNY